MAKVLVQFVAVGGEDKINRMYFSDLEDARWLLDSLAVPEVHDWYLVTRGGEILEHKGMDRKLEKRDQSDSASRRNF